MRASVFPAVVLPVGVWVWTQGAVSRITEFNQYTAAWVHTLAVSTFAVVLAASMLTNAIIVTRRAPLRPVSLTRFSAFPLWQGLLLVATISWGLVASTSESAVSPAEPILAVLVAALSVGVFVLTVRLDPTVRAARARQIALRRRAAGPEWRRRGIRRRTIVLAAVLTLVAGTIAALAFVPVTRTGCEFTGGGSFTSEGTTRWQLFSENCGDFSSRASDPRIEELADGTYTVVTRGYQLDFIPMPIIVSLQREPVNAP